MNVENNSKLEFDDPTDERVDNNEEDVQIHNNDGKTVNNYHHDVEEQNSIRSKNNNNNNNISNSTKSTLMPSTTCLLDTNDEACNNNTTDTSTTTTTQHHPKQIQIKTTAASPLKDKLWEVFTTFWSLGLIAFGGPTAHLAIFREHLVIKRNWSTETEFMELFAIGQILPGPSSTQLIIGTALLRAGPMGGILALLLWTIPGFIALTICGVVIENFVNPDEAPWFLIGIPPAAIALVFPAFYFFALQLDKLGTILALLSCITTILISNDKNISPQSSQFVLPALITIAGLITFIDSKRTKPFGTYVKSTSADLEDYHQEMTKRIGIPLWVGVLIFCIWLIVLIISILLVHVADIGNAYLEVFETMYRIGSIQFGSATVILPLLQDVVVPAWMTKDQFLQGLGLAQSMPGPLLNFSAFIGAVYQGIFGALLSFIGIFGPGVIFMFAAVPFWAQLRHNRTFKSILIGVNASAIGFVGAACVTLWESAIETSADAMVFAISLTLNTVFAVSAPYCIFVGAVVGAILHPDALDLGQQPYCIKAGYKDAE